MTHDYKRKGTVDLFAAMNVATGQVLHDIRRRHDGVDVLAFFKPIDLHVPQAPRYACGVGQPVAHRSEPVRTWLADPKRARRHLHFTPTRASWLNLIEGSVLTRKALTNTRCTSTGQLEKTIDVWASHWNDARDHSCRPRPSTRSSPRSSANEPPSIASLNPRRTTRSGTVR